MDGTGTNAGRISSGVKVIDSFWSGFFKGGRYMVYGRTAAGRNLLPMIFLSTATGKLETSLLVTRLRDVDLYIQASGIGFDADSARASGLLRVSRIPAELEVLHSDDQALESALKALASLIVDASADRVVIDDFSPFSRFSSFDHFRTAFIRLLDEIERVESTILIGMPEPANEASRRIIEMMASHMAGSIHVQTVHHEDHDQRTLSLIPQIGHATHRVDVPWDLESLVARDGLSAMTAGSEIGRQTPILSPRSEQQDDDDASGPYGEIVDEEYLEDVADESDIAEYLDDLTDEQDLEEESDVFGDVNGGDAAPWNGDTTWRDTTPVDDAGGWDDAARDEGMGWDDTTGHDDIRTWSEAPELSVFAESSGQVFEERGRFADELQLYFEDFEASGSPFTLVAMRMEDTTEHSTSDDFNLVSRVVQEAIHREDSMYADPGTERIIVILGESESDVAKRLFSRLKERMRSELPERANELMSSVSAVVVKNGTPFATAIEFLAYVLDED